MNEAAKDFLTVDVEQWGGGGGPVAGHGYLKIDTTMRTPLVAVIGIITKDSFEVTVAQKWQFIQAIRPYRLHPALRVGIDPR